MLSLQALGFGPFQSAFSLLGSDLVPARVTASFGSQFAIAGATNTRAELSGRLRHELSSVERPTAGDWVAIAPAAQRDDIAIVHAVLPRRTALIRRAAGNREDAQVVAANIDTVFVVTSANRDANPRRLERYLAAIADSGARAIVVVNKIELTAHADELLAGLADSTRAPVLGVSAFTGHGLDALVALIVPEHTVAFVGMSGVGKSSLVNRLLGDDRQAVLPIDDNARGRHATTRRELFAVPGGGLVMDTPGMRSFGLFDDDGALGDEVASTFEDITVLAATCRFRDCRHAGEPGCAVEGAIDDGELDPARLAALGKLERELAYAERKRGVGYEEKRQQSRVVNKALRARYRLDPKRAR